MSRHYLLAVAVAVLLLVTGLQLLDPTLDRHAPPTVDFSDSATEVAVDSTAQFEHIDYTYRIEISDDGDGPWEQFVLVEVDHSNHRYRSVGPHGEDGTTIYGNDAAAFARSAPGEPWKVGLRPEMVFPAPGFTRPISLGGASATALYENDSWQVLLVEGVPLKMAPDTTGHAELHIDKDTGLITRAIVEYDVGNGETELMRFSIVEVGTTVDRPQGLPYTSRELVGDLARGPIFHDLITAI